MNFNQDEVKSISYSGFRLMAGLLMFLGHGYGKLMSYLSEGKMGGLAVLGMGSEVTFFLLLMSQTVVALAVAFGFMTRLAALYLAFTMFVAAFIFHADHGFQKQEKAMLYFFMYLFILLYGSGKYSLNAWLRPKVPQKWNHALVKLFVWD